MRKVTSMDVMKDYLQQLKMEHLVPDSVLKRTELHEYEASEYVSIMDESPAYFSICVEGTMKIVPLSENGKVVLLEYLNPGSLLFDIELCCNQNNLHSVLAITPVVLLSVPKHLFHGELKKYPPFMEYLCEKLSHKLYTSSKNYSRAMLYPIKSRLCHYILQLSEEKADDQLVIKLGETAQYLGVTDRHLRRILKELAQQGIIQQTYQRIHILDREGLEVESGLTR